MPFADQTFSWQEAVVTFALISLAAFLVTWVFTDLLRVPRAPYISLLFLVALWLGAAYVAWSGTSPSDLFSLGTEWGLAAGFVAAAIALPMVRRLTSRPHAAGIKLVGLLMWEGLVYGVAEAVLLATLPVLAVWQACVNLGWTDGGWAKIGSGALAISGSLFVILVHHLGYVEFRTRAARRELAGALVVCGLQAIAFLATGSVLAPIVAHVVLHGQLLLRGVELPPAVRFEQEAFSTKASTSQPQPLSGAGAGRQA